MSRDATRWASRRIDVLTLAVLAYLPALLSSPGRMPADTKLYLYTDPGGLVGRAASTFEPDQFAGWVPHQQITYLWPSGPWFWFFELIAVPDWVAHRLWIGSIMFAAGLGVRHCVRLLGHTTGPALAAAAVYQLSPLLLPYISRTSLLLLPWAGLGWIVAATIRATRVDDEESTWTRRWREPAIIAVIVATVGSANATALAMIVPAPVVWLILVAAERRVPVRAAVAVALRVGAACIAVSCWWVAMLLVQSRSGAPVLLYSETLEDVSRTSTGSEVLRGLGYWLFYGRDAFAATTTSSIDHLTRSSLLLVSYAVPMLCVAGIVFGRSRHRRFAGLLAIVGMVLSVGVHPVGDSSPLVRLFSGDGDTGLALALRSSTRALPVMVLGLAIGAAALVERASTEPIGERRAVTPRRLASGFVVLLAVVNLPSLWQAELVDPAIDRQSDLPAAWGSAAGAVDESAANTRVLQVPGAEFGAFEWGYTVDHPLVSATDRDVVTRDLLPLGSAPAMDLLYAFDDRIQNGVLEPASIGPVARLFAAGTVWLSNDIDALRFRTTPPAVVDDALAAAPGLATAESFGDPVVPGVDLDLFGTPLVDANTIGAPSGATSEVALFSVDDAVPITRVKTDVVIVSGSGDGIVDAAAAGLIDGSELLRYGATLDDAQPIETSEQVIVTDSNRDRARHWRSSQDVTGATEAGTEGIDDGLLADTASDQRLDPFDGDAQGDVEGTATVSIQRGEVTATASAYGEPFAYRPEDRPVMAIDGDLDTAWSVGDHGDPVGAILRLTTASDVDSLLLHQIPPAPGGRQISTITVTTPNGAQTIELDTASIDGLGQVVMLDEPATGTIDIRIDAITVGEFGTVASNTGVGFVEVDTGLGATVELIRPPIETLDRLPAEHAALDIVLTRDRVAASSFWRSDPEPALQRLVPLTTSQTVDVTTTVRLDADVSDFELAALIGNEGATADRRLPGLDHRGAAALDGDPTTSWLTPVDAAIGATLAVSAPTADITVLDLVQPVGTWSTITEIEIAGPGQAVIAAVPTPDADGRSAVEVPVGVIGSGEPFAVTITAIDALRFAERRYGDTITMPAGITELSGTAGIEPSTLGDDQVIEWSCDEPLLTIDGAPVRSSFTATVGDLLDGNAVLAEPCDGPLTLEAGDHDVIAVDDGSGFTVDRVVLSGVEKNSTGAADVAPAGSTILVDDTRTDEVEVDCPDGCWLVHGMGYNTAWSASGPDGDLGDPVLVDGGFNGWWIAPTDDAQTIRLTWTAQGPVTWGLVVSVLALLAACATIILARRRPGIVTSPAVTAPAPPARPWTRRTPVGTIAALSIAAALVISPFWGTVVFIVVAADAGLGRTGRSIPLLRLSGPLLAGYVAVAVVVIERRDAPFPNPGWTSAFEHLNGPSLTAVALVAASTILRPGRATGTGRA